MARKPKDPIVDVRLLPRLAQVATEALTKLAKREALSTEEWVMLDLLNGAVKDGIVRFIRGGYHRGIK